MAVMHRGRLRALGSTAELAARLWQGIDADLDLGGPAADRLLDALRGVTGVLAATATATGARVRIEDRTVVPRVVAALVGREVAVYGATPCPPTLEDVYFAIQAAVEGEDAT
jgi:hypothetical protein